MDVDTTLKENHVKSLENTVTLKGLDAKYVERNATSANRNVEPLAIDAKSLEKDVKSSANDVKSKKASLYLHKS